MNENMKERIDQSYRFRGWQISVPLWIITLISFLWSAYSIWAKDELTWLSIISFIVSVIAGLSFSAWLKRTYRCPECGSALGKPEVDETNEEYYYECGKCRIRWRTRTYLPDSGG
jgi:hypothetical protein